ncbi:MAG: DEAD/DEAH box helicase, partial [Planctomycetota bacterium]
MTAPSAAPLLTLHACWGGGRLLLWGEDAATLTALLDTLQRAAQSAGSQGRDHPFAASVEALRTALGGVAARAATTRLPLRLPLQDAMPAPSPHAAHLAGATAPDEATNEEWGTFHAPGLALEPLEALQLLVQERWMQPAAAHGEDLRFFAALARFACALVREENAAPMLVRTEEGRVEARWFAWHSDEATRSRLAALLEAAPRSVCAVQQERVGLWPVVEQALHALVDARCREALRPLALAEALAGRDQDDPHVAWLSGLVGASALRSMSRERVEALLQGARQWLGRLEDRGEDASWRLKLRVIEPDPDAIPVLGAHGAWRLQLALTTRTDGGPVLTAAELWGRPEQEIVVDGVRLERGHDLLLAELDRASRLCPLLERLLRQEQPAEMELSVREAHRLLREDRPILLEQGVDVEPPSWWGQPQGRLGARLTLEPVAPTQEEPVEAAGGVSAGSSEQHGGVRGSVQGLEQMVQLRWRLAIGDREVSAEQLERWAREGSPIVRFEDRWIELLDEDLDAARELLRLSETRAMPLRQAIGVALGVQRDVASLPVVSVDTKGWLESLLEGGAETSTLQPVSQPAAFLGELRPYQLQGLSWLIFLEAHGLGGCLADDMGLGKTIQVLALLLHERETAAKEGAAPPPPTLLVVPTSVMTNWLREGRRFAPSLKLHPHHGPTRLHGEAFAEQACAVDAVVTTYALAQRDVEDLRRLRWRRIVLDEAQKIKNPQAKQTRALASLSATTRLALTGTPVENHLTDLWSIMHFCNPGLLGPLEAFRRNVAGPIEREHDESKRRRLRALIRPFLLRRVKSDPAI